MMPRDTGIPFLVVHGFEIKTLGRVYTFLTASIELATEWVEVLNQKCQNKKAYRYDLDIVSAVDPRDMFALKSKRYTAPGKTILNGGRLCFPILQNQRSSFTNPTDLDKMSRALKR